MTEEATQETPEQPDTVEVSDLDQFVRHLNGWHATKVTQLQHMLLIPEGIEVIVNDGASQILSGDLHKGFLIGLQLGLMELGTLPFAVEMVEDVPNPPDAPVQH